MDAGLLAVALDQVDPLLDPGRLGGQGLARGLDHGGVAFHAGDLVAGAGEPQRLGALAHADVQYAQPPADREVADDLLVELTCHQLLADHVTQPAHRAEPGAGRVGVEGRRLPRHPVGAGGGQGRSPRLTWGLGSRSRRICSERISA